mgnify:CR=1 FL=1
MSEQKQMISSSHHRAWLFSAGIFILLVLAAAGPLVFKAFADMSSAHQAEVQSRNASISAAILDDDYETWASLVTDESLKAQINASNFDTFAEAYRLLQQGELEAADLLKKQLALKEEFQVTNAKSALIGDAIARRDYKAWRSLVGKDYASVVTDANFETYAKLVDASQKGKLNQATRLQYSLGLKTKLNYSSSHD